VLVLSLLTRQCRKTKPNQSVRSVKSGLVEIYCDFGGGNHKGSGVRLKFMDIFLFQIADPYNDPLSNRF